MGDGGIRITLFDLREPGMLFLVVITGAKLGVRRRGGGFAPRGNFLLPDGHMETA